MDGSITRKRIIRIDGGACSSPRLGDPALGDAMATEMRRPAATRLRAGKRPASPDASVGGMTGAASAPGVCDDDDQHGGCGGVGATRAAMERWRSTLCLWRGSGETRRIGRLSGDGGARAALGRVSTGEKDSGAVYLAAAMVSEAKKWDSVSWRRSRRLGLPPNCGARVHGGLVDRWTEQSIPAKPACSLFWGGADTGCKGVDHCDEGPGGLRCPPAVGWPRAQRCRGPRASGPRF